MSLPEVYAATQYGWGIVYCLTVEGVDLVFCERETGLTLPGSGPFAGYSAEDGSLVVDDSAPIGSDIDRANGIGVGLSLGFILLETAAVKSALLAPSHTAKLAANVTATDTEITVDSTSGWDATGSLWLGVERITYGGKSGTQFTGCTRGTAGGKAFAHTMGSASGVATSAPRWWAGRECALWAYAVDPIGTVPNAGAAFASQADVVCVWRGYIEEGPQRIAQGFRFEASALDRRLARPFQARVTGRIVDSTARHTVQPTDSYKVDVEKHNSSGVLQWSHSITWSPYSSLVAGTLYTGAQIRAAVASAFAAAVTAEGAPATTRLKEFRWVAKQTPSGQLWKATIVIDSGAISDADRVTVYFHGDASIESAVVDRVVHNAAQDLFVPPPWKDFWATFDAPNKPHLNTGAGIFGFTIALDNGTPEIVHAPVVVEISGSNGALTTLTCAKTANVQGLLYVSQFVKVSGYNQAGMQIEGKTASAVYNASGSVKQVLLEHLHSSGTTALRDGTYDVLPRAQGYGFITERVAQTSFALIEQGDLASLQLNATTGDRSAVDMFAGLLALAQLAVVARPDVSDTYRRVKLHIVRTSLGGSGGQVTISDSDLLSLADSPVEVLDRARPQNLIRLKLDSDDEIIFTDQASVDTIGTVEQTWSIPHDDREQILQIATGLVASYMATQPTIQTFVLLVAPNIDAHVGDAIQLQLSHPAIYDWQTGTQGYSGSAVVLGRSFDLRSMAIRLTVAASAMIVSRALSPSMLLTAYTAATSCEVDRGWLTHLEQTLADSAGTFRLVIYVPGITESAANYLEINDVSDTGTSVLLSIDAESGALTPTANVTYATLPETANATVFQKEFAHVDDGASWI